MISRIEKIFFISLIVVFTLITQNSFALDVDATAKALRLSNTITGGVMPTTDPAFAQMVAKIQSGDISGAALIATNTNYYASYLAKRLAFQMQNPSLEAGTVTNNDATAFLIAHFAGTNSGVQPSISTIWSENATYLVNINVNGVPTPTRVASLTAAQLAAVNWQNDLVRMDGQSVKNASGTTVALPVKHVGGYITLSDRPNDNSFAMYGATAGTNLRMIEGMWSIATGLTLVDTQSSAARPQDVPRFIPEYDPNFFVGQGQASCISCHGGGFSSLNHGYSAVADVFDFTTNNGLVYIANPTTATKKSLGSDPSKRSANNTCNLTRTPMPVCNPDSNGADVNHGWDLNATWSSTGVLLRMGWIGPTTGQGLNALGTALGQASIVYSFLAKRVIKEICPMGLITEKEVAAIGELANPFAAKKGTDDIRTIIAAVAAHPTCQ